MSDVVTVGLIGRGLWFLLTFSAGIVIFSWVAVWMLTPAGLEGLSEARRLLVLRHRRRMAAHLLRSILVAVPVFPFGFLTAAAAFDQSHSTQTYFYIALGFFALSWLVLITGVIGLSWQLLWALHEEV